MDENTLYRVKCVIASDCCLYGSLVLYRQIKRSYKALLRTQEERNLHRDFSCSVRITCLYCFIVWRWILFYTPFIYWGGNSHFGLMLLKTDELDQSVSVKTDSELSFLSNKVNALKFHSIIELSFLQKEQHSWCNAVESSDQWDSEHQGWFEWAGM